MAKNLAVSICSAFGRRCSERVIVRRSWTSNVSGGVEGCDSTPWRKTVQRVGVR